MRALIILTIIIGCLLTMPLEGTSVETWKDNIEDVYQKDDARIWGDIFSWVFNSKQFEKSYALVIGIGDYQKGWPKLEAPYYDARRVRDFLVNDAGFDYVVTLTNAKATKQKINKLMEETFPSLLGKNDRFLFYFSGHGTQRVRGKEKIPFGYLVLQNCGPEAYADMITMKDIKRWDDLLFPTQHVLFILDSCFSGLAGQQRKSSLTDKKLKRLSQYSHHLITAGTADEESVASLQKWHGSLFTDAFLAAVSGRADLSSRDFEDDGVISLKELMIYVGDRIDNESVKATSESWPSKGIRMSPQISDLQENEGEFFFITKHIKNKKAGNVWDKELERGWPVVKTKGESPLPSYVEVEKQHLTYYSYRSKGVLNKTSMLNDESYITAEILTDTTRNFRLASYYYLKSANQGNPLAGAAMAILRFLGWGVTQDLKRADYWAKRSIGELNKLSNEGNPWAQYYLACLYDDGIGLKKDKKRALELYIKLASSGFPRAKNNLGNLYVAERNYEEAIKLYREAAELGVSTAYYNLGRLYQQGLGVSQDYVEAAELYRKSAEVGDAYAQTALANLYLYGKGVENDYDTARYWYKRAAEQLNVEAITNLGWMYANGKGVPRDYKMAVKYYRQAATRGYAVAQCNLAWMYEGGWGVERNKAKAMEWYRKAAEQGLGEAQEALLRLK